MPYKRHFLILLFLLISAASFSSNADELPQVIDSCSHQQSVENNHKVSNSFEGLQEKILEIDKERR